MILFRIILYHIFNSWRQPGERQKPSQKTGGGIWKPTVVAHGTQLIKLSKAYPELMPKLMI